MNEYRPLQDRKGKVAFSELGTDNLGFPHDGFMDLTVLVFAAVDNGGGEAAILQMAILVKIVVDQAANVINLDQVIIDKITFIELTSGKQGVVQFALGNLDGIEKTHHEIAVGDLNRDVGIILPEGIFKIGGFDI